MKRDSGQHMRDALIEAAITLFAKHGFEATSVQAIVEATNATKGAFYHHFRSKDDVLVAIHQRFAERDLAEMQAIDALGLSASETLACMIEELTAGHDRFGDEIAVFNRERHVLTDPQFESVRATRDQVERILDHVIERGSATGEFQPLPSVTVAAFAILGMTAWIGQWYERSGKMNARDIGRMYAAMLLDGFRGYQPIDAAPPPEGAKPRKERAAAP